MRPARLGPRNITVTRSWFFLLRPAIVRPYELRTRHARRGLGNTTVLARKGRFALVYVRTSTYNYSLKGQEAAWPLHAVMALGKRIIIIITITVIARRNILAS